jgi:cystathionine beta-lyase/cystathionine gamma-synthase
MSREDRDRLGITADLIRISSGIEGTQDLVGDFAQALEAASA